jgi:hypothetical protein
MSMPGWDRISVITVLDAPATHNAGGPRVIGISSGKECISLEPVPGFRGLQTTQRESDNRPKCRLGLDGTAHPAVAPCAPARRGTPAPATPRGAMDIGERLFAGIHADVCGHPAVDRNHLPGDVARLLRCQENNQVSHVFRLSEVRREGHATQAVDGVLG